MKMLTDHAFWLIGFYLVPYVVTLLAWNRSVLMAIALIWVAMMFGLVLAGPFDERTVLTYLPMVALGTAVGFAIRRYTLSFEGRHMPRLGWSLVVFCGVFVPALVLTAPFWVGIIEAQP